MSNLNPFFSWIKLLYLSLFLLEGCTCRYIPGCDYFGDGYPQIGNQLRETISLDIDFSDGRKSKGSLPAYGRLAFEKNQSMKSIRVLTSDSTTYEFSQNQIDSASKVCPHDRVFLAFTRERKLVGIPKEYHFRDDWLEFLKSQ
jgi:hypothetical protein